MQKVQIIGYVGQEPKFINKGGKDFTSFSVGVSEKQKDGSKTTDWFSCLVYGQVPTFLNSGAQVFVDGKQSFETYKGEKQAKILVNTFRVFKSKEPEARNY